MIKSISYVFLAFLLIQTTQAGKSRQKTPVLNKKWLTLNGAEPIVAARGGLSGVFPEMSEVSFRVAQVMSLPSTLMYCDLQFARDGSGFCLSDINIASSTTILDVFPDGEKTYNINGKDVKGWFGFDYDFTELAEKVSLIQNIHSRPAFYDGEFRIEDPFSLSSGENPFNLWLNVEYDTFYKSQKISPSSYIQEVLKTNAPQIISSPEIGFLKEIAKMKGKANTKLILKFQQRNATEPSSNVTYDSLMKKLPIIKTFASGILVPKEFIWPVNADLYLEPHTSLVPDAHKLGLEVYAYGFSNDIPASYNYSYDPALEYLQFIDNSEFSVDGVLSDFSVTASEAISCLSQNKNAPRKSKTLIISHDGASGDFCGSTDLAYQKAINDGVDIIDCSVQLSKDGVAFCLNSADLTKSTNAIATFQDQSVQIPEIQSSTGIFSFNLSWTDIQSLQPQLRNFYGQDLDRNPINKKKGKFLTLPEFLELSKKENVGVLINIVNARYLASTKGLDMIKSVTKALTDAGFDKQTKQKVLIQSDDTSVLQQFKEVPTYQRVLSIFKDVSGVLANVSTEIKKYADAVTVQRNAIVLNYPDPVFMTKNISNLVDVMHAANISVYVGIFRNEFPNLLFDYFSDPYVELATHVHSDVDGVITEYPATASAYMRSPCVDLNNKDLEYTILPVVAGDIYHQTRNPDAPEIEMAPVSQPLLISTDDIVDPPLPPMVNIAPPVVNLLPGSPDMPSSTLPTAASDTLIANENNMV